MPTEILTLEVKSDIKNATQDLNELGNSLKNAVSLEGELSEQIRIQNGVLIDLERQLIQLKATQDQIPEGAWWEGQDQLATDIQDVTTEIKLEQNALKDLKNQQRDTNDEIKTAEKNIKDVTKAHKAAVVPAGIFAKSLRGIGLAIKGFGIGLLVSGLLLLKRAFQQNETVMKVVNAITNTMSNLITDIIDGLKDVYKWVGESSDRFDGMKTVLTNLMTLGLTPLKAGFLGLKLAVEKTMLGFFQLRKFLKMEGAAERIKEIKGSIVQTNLELMKLAEGAVDAGKAIYNNIGEAVDEFGNVIKQTKDELSDLELDPIKRTTKDKDTKGKTEKTAEEIALEKQIALTKELDDLETDRTNKLIEDGNKLIDEYYDTLISAEQRELNAVHDKYFAIIEGKRALGHDVTELEEAQEAELTKITKKYSKQREKTLKAEKDFAKQSAMDQLSAFGNLAGALSSLAGDNREMAAASAIIDTYVGANKALAQGGAVGFVGAAAVIASGLANVKKIYETDPGSAGGGSVGSESQTPAPQMMSGAFELTGGVEPEPLQAYVVSDEITASQNSLEIIRRRATI
tara:strand:+ start:2406 stop:4121 length:1716 start_codon:yes stop_codon:yes gene_type:complete